MKHALPREDADYLLGDYAFIFSSHTEMFGRSYARKWYWRQVLKTLPGFLAYRAFLCFDVILNTLKVMLRSTLKQKAFMLINVSGLALGMACTCLLFLWVYDEVSYDRFHSRAGRICRLITGVQQADRRLNIPRASSAIITGIEDEFPEVIEIVNFSIRKGFSKVLADGNAYNGFNVAFSDPAFFRVFDFRLLQGDPDAVLSRPNSVVITRGMGERLFGHEDPLGRAVHIDGFDLQVTGILDDVPRNSHLEFDCVVSALSFADAMQRNELRPTIPVYVLLERGTAVESLNQKIEDRLRRWVPEPILSVRLQPLTRIHLDSREFVWEYAVTSDPQYVTLLSVMGALILIIASINFINLMTARSAPRMKEIAIRKVSGAKSEQVFWQWIMESVLMTLIAAVLAVFLICLLLPPFNNLAGKSLRMSSFLNPVLISGWVSMVLCVGIFSGLFPAMLFSGIEPASLLSGVWKRGPRRPLMRRFLVITQFALSVFFIVGALVIHRQLRFISHTDLGYEAGDVFVVGGISDYVRDKDTVVKKLRGHPYIIGVTRGFRPIYHQPSMVTGVRWEGQNPDIDPVFQRYQIDSHYFTVFRIDLIEGRNFEDDLDSDASNFIINEEAARLMNLDMPVGMRLTVDDQQGFIIGVVKDYHHCSLHHSIQPLILCNQARNSLAVNVRIDPEHQAEAIDFVKVTFEELVPDYPYDHIWIEDTVSDFYLQEKRIARILRYTALLAVFIACLGLFGLASYMAENRTKEIGIRKTVGAHTRDVFSLIVREFIVLIVLANLIAWPVAWIVMRDWLQEFAYRIRLGTGMFFTAGLVTLVITFLTVGYRAMRAAKANPVDALRYE